MKKRTESAVLAAAGVLALSPQAYAREQLPAAAASHQACSAASEGISALAECGEKYVSEVQARLAQTFADAKRGQSRQVQAQLDREQAAWEVYLGASCHYFASDADFGREGSAVQYPLCRAHIIQKRIDQLHNLFKRSEPAKG